MKDRPKNAKKGDFGKVLVIGGSEDYVGCLYLAGMAALRSGCDWVTIAAPKKVAWAINCLSPDLITKKINCKYFTSKNLREIKKLIEVHDVILIGNGIGMRKETQDFVKKIIVSNKLKVIDADALKYIDMKKINNCIFTPHKKEFELMLINSKLNKNNFQLKLKDNILLLKGNTDIIYSEKKIKKNNTGNPGMTVAGTGDILAGLVAGFLAQGYDKLTSAYEAAKINGKIGDLLKKKKKYSYIASDMVEEVKKCLQI